MALKLINEQAEQFSLNKGFPAKRITVAFVMCALVLSLSACGTPGNSVSADKSLNTSEAKKTDGSKTLTNFVLDEKNAVDVEVAAAVGGTIGLNASKDIKIRIAIPRQSLKKDTRIIVAPLSKAPVEDKDTIAKGFSLEEKGTGNGPKLKLPATIIFTLKGQMPADTSIVKYHRSDNGFEAIPTTINNKNGIAILTASVDGFSAYGVRKGIDNTGSKGGDNKQSDSDNSTGKTWTITVNDSYSFNYGSLKVTATVNLNAVNSSGKIDGDYKGTVVGKLDQSATSGDLKLSAPTVSTDNNVNFFLAFPLADLVPIDPEADGLPQLASLTPPENDPDWSASGSFNMLTSGTATVTGRGRSASGAVKAPKTATPFEINIKGSDVRLVVKHPNATMYFDGTIQGSN